MSIHRLVKTNNERVKPESVPLDEWLHYLEHRRAVILMELRHLEPVLVKYGRLKDETPRRIR